MSIPEEVEGGSSTGRSPHVGAVATEDNLDEIESLCAQALRQQRDVVLACPEEIVGELPPITDTSGVTVLAASSKEDRPGSEQLSTRIDELLRPGSTTLQDSSHSLDLSGESREQEDTDTTTRTPSVHNLVAIPAYNEEQTIRDVAESALKHADEVVVIDDGSTDNTIREAWRANVDIVAHTENRGYGSALKTAFAVADKRGVENLIILDGDGQHEPADISALVQPLDDGDANVVIGSRFIGESTGDIPLYRRLGLMVINILTNLSLGNVRRASWIRDTQCGLRAYDQEAITHLSARETIGNDMGASLDILYELSENGYTIEEHPVVVNYDVPSGSSKNPLTHGFGLILTILRTTLQKHLVPILATISVLAVLFTSFLLLL